MNNEVVEPGTIWEHLNGRKYRVLCVAHEEDLGLDFVVHQGLHDSRIWARSLVNFTGYKLVEGEQKKRFRQVG